MIGRAIRYIRGEGWTVTKLAPDRWRVRQLGDDRTMDAAQLLAFAGMQN